ncbi:ribonuclease HII [Prevotella dentalis DSM 3688]|uniref:Ribonuclease HII n=1 Tax=Prevotella dentalis (strain ATCC 49559 / DSM 3688 / JCM 13448 / NCTC 12043 / ES 2772) TaxID=908937 RepID=F9D298_PREDD|nr:ribonuclease HII [Prevotella dentalis DSM 3688]
MSSMAWFRRCRCLPQPEHALAKIGELFGKPCFSVPKGNPLSPFFRIFAATNQGSTHHLKPFS